MQANVKLPLHVDNAYYSLPTIFRVLGDLLLTSKSTITIYFISHQPLYYEKQNEIFIIDITNGIILTVSHILLLSKRHFYVYIVGYLQPH